MHHDALGSVSRPASPSGPQPVPGQVNRTEGRSSRDVAAGPHSNVTGRRTNRMLMFMFLTSVQAVAVAAVSLLAAAVATGYAVTR